MKTLIVGCLILLALIVIILLIPRPKGNKSASDNNTQPTNTAIADQSITNVAPINSTPSHSVETPDSNDSRLNRLPDGRVEFLQSTQLASQITNDSNTETRIRVIESILSDFRYAYKENPVGSENTEITQQLLGNNPKRIVFVNSSCASLVGQELVDQWGEPLFFHALSGKNMEVRSAGKDKIMWTEDDVISDKF